MPELSRFLGIVVYMLYDDHRPPHFHAEYGEYKVSLEIGTGVVEGTCRHLVKDRMELSGMRWTLSGAGALLALRAVNENGNWETFHEYRRKQRHKELYGTPMNTRWLHYVEQLEIN